MPPPCQKAGPAASSRDVAQSVGADSERPVRCRAAVHASARVKRIGSSQGLMKILRLGSDQMRGAGAVV